MKAVPAVFLVVAIGMMAAVPSLSFASLVPGFVENRGQVNESVQYYLSRPGATVYFTHDALVLDLMEPMEDMKDGMHEMEMGSEESARAPRKRCAVYLRFEGANPTPTIEPRHELAAHHNYFLGKDESRWQAEVPIYSEILYRDAWPGVDLRIMADARGVHYEILSESKADRNLVRFTIEGAENVLTETGSRQVIDTPIGSVTHAMPGTDGNRGSLSMGAEYAEMPAGSAFKDNPDALLWSTYLGGSDYENLRDMVLDSSGNPLATGTTGSTDFPTTPGSYDEAHNGSYDVYVAKLNAAGSSLLWATFLGGSSSDGGWALTLDPSGNPTVTGATSSTDFPTTPGAYDSSYSGGDDGFAAKLDASGSSLLWSTYLGGTGDEVARGVALDASNNVIVVGSTVSSDFPSTPGAYDETHNNAYDCFITKLNSTGSALLWSTFLGGIYNNEFCNAVALGASDSVVVAGSTTSSDFPTTAGAYDETYNGGSYDIFLSKLDPTGSVLAWSTFIGGSDTDGVRDLKLDGSGNAIVVGYTKSSDGPTTAGAFDETFNGFEDGYLAKLSASGDALLWGTFLGGTELDGVAQVMEDANGDLFITGHAYSPEFPVTPGAYDDTHNGQSDGYVARIDASGSTLLWGTFLGGSGHDYPYAIALDESGYPVVAGYTGPDFPTTPGAHDQTVGGSSDGFLAKISTQNRLLVCLDGSGDFTTVQAAIDASSDGDIIELCDGIYSGTGNRDLDYGGRAITIRSQSGNRGACIINAQGSSADPHRCFHFYSGEDHNSDLESVTLIDGYADYGGAILCDGASPHVSDCVFTSNNSQYDGAAVWCRNAAGPLVEDSRFIYNWAGDDAGAIGCRDGSNPWLMNCTIVDNASTGDGGAFYIYNASIILSGCTVADNHAGNASGAIVANHLSDIDIVTSIVAFNTGGQAAMSYDGSTVDMMCSDVYGNETGDWVGCLDGQDAINDNLSADPLYCARADRIYTLHETSPCAPANSPGTCGQIGAHGVDCHTRTWYVATDGDDDIGDGTQGDPFGTIEYTLSRAFAGDSVSVAAGTYYESNITMPTGVVLLAQSAKAGDVTIDAQNGQKLFYIDDAGSDTVIDGFTLTGGTSGYGGAIYCRISSPVIRNCTFVDNVGRANEANEWHGRGGAIYLHRASPAISYCTFVGNVGDSLGQGGAVYCGGSVPTWSHPTFDHCTFYGNQAELGEGSSVYVNGFSSASLDHCILAGGIGDGAVVCDTAAATSLACCDIYGNAGGDWVGCITGQNGTNGNFSAIPMFCNPDSGDFSLADASPCAPDNSPAGCNLIGAHDVACTVTGVEENPWGGLPRAFHLANAVPNPFNPITEIGYAIPAGHGASRVTLNVYDTLGRRVRTLVDRIQSAGAYAVAWDGTDRDGSPAASGVYFYQITWDGRRETKRMILLK